MSKPKKPDRPLRSITFPKSGPPRENIEHLPLEQGKLDLEVGMKFIGSLAHFRGETYTGLREGPEEPADLSCFGVNGAEIYIQVTTIVDQLQRTLWQMRNSYREEIVTKHSDALQGFSGCSVTLVDVGDPPYLPRVNRLESGTRIEAVAQMLGHRSIETTRHYARLSDQAVRREAEKAWGSRD